MSNKRLFLRLILPVALAFSANLPADTVKLTSDHPDDYVVVKGDTLWDISSRFLQDPWLWPEIWQINPAIQNPHLIYPGDIIHLQYVDGKPVLTIQRGEQHAGLPTVKLSPGARFSSLETAIPTIPVDAIKQFLLHPRIVSDKELETSPYIVATAEDHLISGSGDKVYVRGLDPDTDEHSYNIVRKGKIYRDPADSKRILGIEAINVADADLTATGDPSTLVIRRANREVLKGDRLLPQLDEEPDQHFTPHAPQDRVEGQIISVLDGVSRIGRLQTVVINRGKADGLERGHVLAVYRTGEEVQDTIGDVKRADRMVKLPNERAGTLMIVRLFDNISYALVMEATRDLRILDTIENP
ncbi:MAG: LysM peptidoglycan-binding domain-containing protein [Gammaproteobacteria bacterium]|nr:LysM peptidoglycan-binding domain-containing protein [Gammaproteobacteria bacterium]